LALETLRPRAVASLAHHYAAAGVADKTYEFACLSAERAVAVYAHDHAVALLETAEVHAVTSADRARARIRRAEINEGAGKYSLAESLYRKTIADFGKKLDEKQRAQSLREIIRLRSLQGAPVEATRAECQQLLAEAEALGLQAERAALLLTLSQSHSRTGDAAYAEQLARECLAIADSLGDARLRADAQLRLGSAMLQARPTDAMLHYARAMQLYTRCGDVVGQVRCQINIGVANTYIGCLEAAETSYREALVRGRHVHAPDVAGLAALNLGALFMKRGILGEARSSLEEALVTFRKVGNEAHRVAAIHNLAHLAREEGRVDDAIASYREAAHVASAIGLREVVVGAHGAIGLLSFDRADAPLREAAWRSVADDLDAVGTTWFQGRELAEAFGIRVSLARGDVEVALQRFEDSVTTGSDHDAYGAAWLAVSCAPELADHAVHARAGIRDVLRECAARVDMMGTTPLSARFSILMDDVRFVDDAAITPQIDAG
jgi:tetratricopeptide (TPR) repeat protein